MSVSPLFQPPIFSQLPAIPQPIAKQPTAGPASRMAFPPGWVKPPGSVNPRGAKWLAQQPPSAGRKSKTFDTEADGWLWLARQHATSVLLTGSSAEASSMPLREALSIWLDGLVVKESTRESYRHQLRAVMAHPMSLTPMCDVRPALVEMLVMVASPGNPRVKVADRFRRFFFWATAGDLITRDPFIRSQCETVKRRELLTAPRCGTTGMAWTVDEARVFIASFDNPRSRALAAFMLVTGARRGEALGLRCGAINGQIASLGRNRTLAGGKVFEEERPKTLVIRNAYFGPRMEAMLHDICPPRVRYDDYLFAYKDGRPLSPSGVTNEFRTFADRIGIRKVGSTHALRRTFATALETDGCPAVVREELLGHSASRYARPQPEDLVLWGNRADELFLDGLV